MENKNLIIKLLKTLFIISFYSSNAQSLTYEHVGISDKPLPYFIIKNNGIKSNLKNDYLIKQIDFNKLYKIIKSNKSIYKNDTSYSFGTYLIRYKNRNDSSSYLVFFNDDRKNLDNQQKCIKSYPLLNEIFLTLKNRLGYK